MKAQIRLTVSSGLRDEREILVGSWYFLISNAGLFLVIVWLPVAPEAANIDSNLVASVNQDIPFAMR